MRAVGLDLGTKTIGIAVSDELGLTAQGLKTLERRSLKKDIAELAALAQDLGADRFILGLPLNMDGTEGPRAAATRKFGDALQVETKLPVLYQDERLTTVSAERALLEADVSRKKRRAVIDQVAASLILQSWLDAQPRPEQS
ncbi:MAG: Holliday junction resolvase RuvX [Myxococcota bacterium]